jgi:hypothetical protein
MDPSNDLIYVKTPDSDPSTGYYWKRRAPYITLWYNEPKGVNFFYNEVTIPKGYDPLYTYFAVNGFYKSYFGIQVTEIGRVVINSMWNPDDAECASDSKKCTTLISKGTNVISNNFSGEGTGVHTHLIYPWLSGTTYKFLSQTTVVGNDTRLSSWFFDPAINKWIFIATFNYPGEKMNLSNSYSFNESFGTNNFQPRKMILTNQWISADGINWNELTGKGFNQNSAYVNDGGHKLDITEKIDFNCGLTALPSDSNSNNAYFLQAGFFDSNGLTYTNCELNSKYSRNSSGNINSSQLADFVLNLPRN